MNMPIANRIDAGNLGTLGKALAPLVACVNSGLRHGEQPDVEAIARAGEEALLNLEGHLAGASEPGVAEVLRVARYLKGIAEGSLWTLNFFAETTPFERTEQYGTLDPLRFRAAFLSVERVVAQLATRGLSTVGTAQEDPSGSARTELVELLTHAHVRLGDTGRAIELLEALALQESADAGQVWLCLERCHLSRADIAAAAKVRERGRLGPGSVHRLTEFAGWVAAEGLQSERLFVDGPEWTTYQVVRDDGRVRTYRHEVQAVEMHAARATDLRVLASYLLVGRQGTVLRPSRYVEYGEFPYMSRAIVNRVTGPNVGVTLRVPERHEWKSVTPPLLLLDHMHLCGYNYYHWMLENLSRIAWADENGLLAGRKVLVPAKLRPWMLEALAGAGISERQLHYYRPNECLVVEDALVVSSVDFSSRSLAATMQHRFLNSAGVGQPSKSRASRRLFLSRRADRPRAVMDLEKIERLAIRKGFEVVLPESLGIHDQVRLFSQAGAIAGLEGAAFTNQLFAPAGIRVLSIAKEEDNEPTYINLSQVVGQERRCLLGVSAPADGDSNPLASTYSLREELVAEGLDWALGG